MAKAKKKTAAAKKKKKAAVKPEAAPKVEAAPEPAKEAAPVPVKPAKPGSVPRADECSAQYETDKFKIFKLKPSARKKYGGLKKVKIAK